MLATVCKVNFEVVPSPVLLSPTIRPYPISWFSLTPTILLISLILIAFKT